MTHKEEYVRQLMDRGQTGTVTVVTGTVCPCMTSRDVNVFEYSAYWHELHRNEHCNGTGLIDVTTTQTTIRSFFTNEMETMATYLSKQLLTEIGEKQTRYLMMLGCAAAGSMFDLSSLNRRNAVFTFNSKDYRLMHFFDLDCCQVGILFED